MTKRSDIAARLPVVLGLPEAEAAASIGVSVTFFRAMVEDGRMPQPRMLNSRRIYDVDDLRIAFKSLPSEGDLHHDKWSAVG